MVRGRASRTSHPLVLRRRFHVVSEVSVKSLGGLIRGALALFVYLSLVSFVLRGIRGPKRVGHETHIRGRVHQNNRELGIVGEQKTGGFETPSLRQSEGGGLRD